MDYHPGGEKEREREGGEERRGEERRGGNIRMTLFNDLPQHVV